MNIRYLEQRLREDTRVDDLFDDFLIERYNGKVEKVEVVRSKQELFQKIKEQKEEPTYPVKITFITEKVDETSRDMTGILEKLNDDILNLPYIEDIHNEQDNAPLSRKYEHEGEVMHEGVYSVIEHWTG